MPEEPNRNIEEQLKACAQKRRDEAGGPLELHPVTRKRLQDEVARTYSVRVGQPAPKPDWRALLWPRLALAGSICALLAILVGLLLPAAYKSKLNSMQLARRNEKTSPSSHSVPSGAPAEAVSSNVQFGDLGGRGPGEVAFNGPAPSATPQSVTTALVPAGEAETKLAEQRSYAQRDSKDSREKQLAEVIKKEDAENLKKSVQLADANKAKESPVLQSDSTVATRGLTTTSGNESLLQQRYGLVPGQASKAGRVAGETVPDDKSSVLARSTVAAAQPSPAKGPQKPQVSPDGAGAAGGFAGGKVQAGKTVLPTNPVLAEATRREEFGELKLALEQQKAGARPAQNVALGANAELDRAQRSDTYAFLAAGVRTQVGQQFTQTAKYRRNFNSPPMPSVLNSFQIEQNGRQVRVVDADGSIYDGEVEERKREPTQKVELKDELAKVERQRSLETESVKNERGAFQANGDLSANQNLAFHVAGTNRTLNQLVVFTGNFSGDTNLLNNAVATNGVAAAGAVNALNYAPIQNLPSLNQVQFPGARVQGQATIGQRNRIEIDAASVGP